MDRLTRVAAEVACKLRGYHEDSAERHGLSREQWLFMNYECCDCALLLDHHHAFELPGVQAVGDGVIQWSA